MANENLNRPIDVFLKDEGDFVTIGFQTEKARTVLYNDGVLKKLYYCITDDNTGATYGLTKL